MFPIWDNRDTRERQLTAEKGEITMCLIMTARGWIQLEPYAMPAKAYDVFFEPEGPYVPGPIGILNPAPKALDAWHPNCQPIQQSSIKYLRNRR